MKPHQKLWKWQKIAHHVFLLITPEKVLWMGTGTRA